MKLKYAIVTLVIVWTYLLLDTVVCLSMQVIDDNYRPCYEEETEEEKDFSGLSAYRMTATAYCLPGKTASGELVREGIVASKPEWIGKVVAIYIENKDGSLGEFLGYFDVSDTGGENIRAGRVVDIWMPTEDICFQFGRKRVVVFLMDGKSDETNEKADIHTKAEAV